MNRKPTVLQAVVLTDSVPKRIVKRLAPPPARRMIRRAMQWPHRLRFALAASDLLPSTNHKRLIALRNKHAGQRMFVIGGGPSLRTQNLHLMRDEVTIAFNTFFNTANHLGWLPTYYMVEDSFAAEDNQAEINALSGTTKIFAHDLRYCLKPDQQTIYTWFDRYYADYPSPRFPKFSKDAASVVYWGGTVTFMGMQLAYYMGAKEVYLLGIDLTFNVPKNPGDFALVSAGDSLDHAHPNDYGKGKRIHAPRIDRMQCAIEHAAKWMQSRGVKVYNVTAGGQLKHLPRKSYDKLFDRNT